MMELKRYKDIFTDPLVSGIMTHVFNGRDLIVGTVEELNINYAMLYNNRPLNDLSINLLENDHADILGQTIYNRCADNWKRLKLAYEAEYNPIENYDKTEDITQEVSYGHTVENSEVKNRTDNSTTETTETNTNTSENISLTSGFDSSEFVNDGKNTDNQTSNGNRDTSINGEITENNSNNETHGGKDTTTTTNRTHGNIGVTTAQQMILEEFNMRMKYYLYDVICNDVSAFISLNIY